MHRKMRGSGRGGLQAMQDVATTPEVSQPLWISITSELFQEVSGLRALKTGIVRAWRQSKHCDVTLVASDKLEVAAHR